MSDPTPLPIDDQMATQSVITSHPSNSISQESRPGLSQFLTVSYNPAAHPRQISLLDANGQPIQYTLVPANQNSSVPIASHLQPNNMAVRSMDTPVNANVCCVCGNHAVTKCSYGISRGNPCGRLLCLSHVMELSGANGGRYPHCPEHFQFIQQNKCNVM